jgi:hypothetical protein
MSASEFQTTIVPIFLFFSIPKQQAQWVPVRMDLQVWDKLFDTG